MIQPTTKLLALFFIASPLRLKSRPMAFELPSCFLGFAITREAEMPAPVRVRAFPFKASTANGPEEPLYFLLNELH